MKIETKYSIGDTVYHGRSETVAVRTLCPDCRGTKERTVTTPAGISMQAPCSTCDTLYGPVGFIERHERSPKVETLTIGSVRLDTNDSEREAVSYMCRETGIGSGSIWYEERLRSTREEAEADAVASIAIDEQRVADSKAACEKERLKKAARRAERRAA